MAGVERLRRMGYEPVYSEDIFDRDIYFAGSADRRVHEFNEFWRRHDIAALICVRGGYGSNYVLERLGIDRLGEHPKALIGCSDITSLLTAIHDRTGLITFHGPMVAKDIAGDSFDLVSWNHALGGSAEWDIPLDGVEVLRTGSARGTLYGGCLSMLVASLGTPFEIETKDTIFF